LGNAFLRPHCLTKEKIIVLAEDFVVVDANSLSWSAVRPYVEVALRLEQNEDSFTWHGWDKQHIDTFLHRLPSPCTLLVAVWDEVDAVEEKKDEQSTREILMLGCVCEVAAGEVRSVRTFESLHDDHLPPLEELEPGYQHALELMRVVRGLVAPVAWALFTDKQTWNDWIFTEDTNDTTGSTFDKGELLAQMAQQGRCVLMGSQTTHHP
jgi:hypothetical protein